MSYAGSGSVGGIERLPESVRAVYDMGCKLHTLLLKNACTESDGAEEDEGLKKVNLLLRWPAIAQEKGFNVDTAHSLTRTLATNLISALIAQVSINTNLALPISTNDSPDPLSNSKQQA